MSDPDEVKRGIDIAIGIIAYRMRSEAEVRRRLKRAGLDESDLQAVIDRLKEMRLVDDQAFAGAYTRDQIFGKGRGPIRVERGLLALGIAKDTAVVAIHEVLSEHDMFTLALTQGEKRWIRLGRSGESVQKKKKKVYEYLVRLGHSFEDARRVVRKLEGEHE